MIKSNQHLYFSFKMEENYENDYISVKLCNIEEERNLWDIDPVKFVEYTYYASNDMNFINVSIDLICACVHENSFIRHLCKGMVNYG